ncbi:MAG TPA: F0F1 ATP synthase subunit delta [Nocardioides sp.]|uniref:F0F1 ATP synthase subunit delta n=1 Tax=Nocardioides sp. TaxID=35761 RepID=UPI002E3429AC|nr:F0F1 ATP synthase subunit delta [Nocardioides sp.]HEX3931773.1 F0F1 ATP synthase subunit delta [Nocardioides sp.]
MDLRGASAEALAALTEQLDDATTGKAAAATLGDELFTVSGLLRGEAGLRRFATDASLPAEAKQGMVQQVFKGRLGDPGLGLLTDAVGRRWTLSRDLADVLERLSEIAAVRSAGSDASEVGDQLFELSGIIDANPDLRSALSDPARSVDDKAGLLGSLLEGKALPATITLATQALSGTYGPVTVALATYREVAAATQGEAVATVRVARPLSRADQDRLARILGTQYATTVHLNVVVDPDVLGGIRVEIGDEVIDGTIASRLDDARRRLVG